MSSVFALKVTPKKQIFLFLNLLLKIIDMFFNSSFDLFEFDAINITEDREISRQNLSRELDIKV